MIDTATTSGTRNGGHFAKGNPGGPGNPHGRQVALIRSALLAALTPEVLQEILARLVEHAVEGNMAAIKLLLGYAVGRPGKAEDLLVQMALTPGAEAGCVTQATPEELPEAPVPSPAAVESRQQTVLQEAADRQQTVLQEEADRQQTDFAPLPGRRDKRRRQTSHAARMLKAALVEGDRQQTELDALDKAIELVGLAKAVLDPAAAGVALPVASNEFALVS